MRFRFVHPSKASTPKATQELYPNVISDKLVQLLKAYSSIRSTDLGMVTEVREEQLLKADQPMEVTLFGMVTEVREEQPLKAEPPMEVTLFGMVTEVREEQLLKA